MLELKLLDERPRTAIDVFTTWLPRIGVAIAFLVVGSQKLVEPSIWTPVFHQLGAGTWLRYLTGVMQVGGALLLLIPATVAVGCLLLGSTMVGASFMWIFVAHRPFFAFAPTVLLAVIVAVGWQSLWNLGQRLVSK